jgi:SLT domain-containing protein
MQRVSDTLDERTIAAQEAAAAGQEMAESTRQVISTGEEFTAATQPIIDQMTALAEAYNTAYTAAYNSMNGQFELFEAAPEVVTASTEDMIANMQSQIDYINKYTENLKFLQEAGLDTDILASLSDGSAESAGYIQALVDDVAKNGGAAIDEINDKFSEVSKAKEGFADTVAEMQTDFSDKMAALEEQLNTTVQNMDMSTEAAASAAATMDAFAASAEGKVDKVRQAFAKAAAAAKAALTVDVDGDGYATGTQNAEPGFHVVGEKGPEIVYLNGGEKILNAQDTQRAMDAMSIQPVNAMSASGSGGQYSIEYKPQYNISGSMNADELQRVLDEHDAGMRDRLEEMMDDIENDRNRRRYA